MPVARILGGIGRVLITAGLLVLAFVAYQLYGTGLAEARAQEELRDEFAAALATTTTTTTASPAPTLPGASAAGAGPTTTTTTTITTPTTAAARPEGEAVALIRIPAVGIDKAVVEGVTAGDLKKGPGHYPGTPMPGHGGNSAIAGHRTTYGAPFGDLGEVEEGDEILVTTHDGDFRYVVDRIRVVSPSQVEVLAPSEAARLTLTTCHPKFSARKRLVVSGVLATEPLPSPPPPPAPPADAENVAPADEETGTEPATAAPAPTIDDPSLAGDPTARVPAAGWATATGLVALAAWYLGRRWHRWPAYLSALPVGAVTLFHCFEQVARLFPANI